MAKTPSSPNPDEPHADAQPQDGAGEPSPPDPTVDVGEKTEPNVQDITVESIEDVMDANDGKPAVGEKTEPNLLDSTVDSIRPSDVAADEQPTGSKTVESIGDKTEANILESTVESIEKATARKSRVRMGSNVEDLEKTAADLNDSIAPFGMAATEKTLGPSDLEKTVAFGGTVDDVTNLSTLEQAAAKQSTEGDTHESGFEQTVNLNDFDADAGFAEKETVESGSPLASSNTGRTINPRELTPQDAKLWDSLAVKKSRPGQETKAVPAIERSFSETKLQIRPRDVVTPKHGPETPSDYRLIRLLGKGGMGNVFMAKQESLDRIIAVKVIKPLEGKKRTKLQQSGRLRAVETDRRHQFLSEAVVTGDLDHPNIVPIYDIAIAPDESLFYAMKRVVGTPWSKVLKEKTLDENLDILLKVADAVGFAHTRGVIHRDIKPENIMLGDFGVVMVMDWGLALAQDQFEKRESIVHTAGLGGTPAFMAPEMATGPVEKIGPAADIYLLGATLFQLITGSPPHQARNVSDCIRAVATNSIREVQLEHQGELMNIALQAMQTEPRDRYRDVPDFQTAIREYRSHLESIILTARASEDLKRGHENRDYKDFSRATYGFEEAIALWPGNEPAKAGLAETRVAHADGAYENGDFDLGLSLLDPQEHTHQPIILKLQDGLRERELRQSRLTLFTRAAAAMLAFILVGGAVALYLINDQRSKALTAESQAKTNLIRAQAGEKDAKEKGELAIKKKLEADENARIAMENAVIAKNNADIAEANAQEARDQKAAAEMSAMLALQAQQAAEDSAKAEKLQAQIAKNERENAETQRKNADQKAAEALRQKKNVEYEVYLSQIGLAKARIDQNEFDDARRILDSLKSTRGTENLGWEWRWLSRQASQSKAADQTKSAAVDLAISHAGRQAAVVLEDGSIELASLGSDGIASAQRNVRLPIGIEATSVAFSIDDQLIAVGAINGEISVFDNQLTRRLTQLQGHEERISDLAFSPTGHLVSGSLDRSARVWDIATGTQLAACWHIAAVRGIALAERARGITLVTAVADSSTGRAVVWELSGSRNSVTATRSGEFLDHHRPVSCVAISPRGDVVATGDIEGNVLIWRPVDIAKTDYAAAIANAVRRSNGGKAETKKAIDPKSRSQRLIDQSAADSANQLVSMQPAGREPDVQRLRAHSDVIESLRFSGNGDVLISTSDDYTLKLWDTSSRMLQKTLRGHGGWVTDANFVPDSAGTILSVSRDGTIRTWDPKSYVDQAATLTMTAASEAEAPRENRAHNDEIWSARFDRSGKQIVSASRDHTARILSIDPTTMSFTEITRLKDADRQPNQLTEGTAFLAMSVAVDRAHRRLYIGSADSTVRVWDLDQGNELARATGTGLNNVLALSSDGRLLMTGSSSSDAKAILWDIDPTGKVSPRQRIRFRGHDQAVTAFTISPDGRQVFTCDRVGLGILWDTKTGRQIGPRFELLRGFRINDARFSADGTQLLIAADDQQVTIVDVARRQPVQRLKHDGFVTQLSLSADGRLVLTVSESRSQRTLRSTAMLWNLADGKGSVLDRVERTSAAGGGKTRAQGARISSARFGPQSQLAIVSRSSDSAAGELKLFSIDQTAVPQLKPKSFKLPSKIGSAEVAMPISNRNMLTLNGDAAFLWDLQTMSHVKSYRAHSAVTQASFSFDGRYVATGSRSVKIWDAQTGLSLGKLENPHQGPVRAVQFSPAGPSYTFATASDDGIARVWSWNPTLKEFEKTHELAVEQLDAEGRKSFAPIRSIYFSSDGRSLLTAGARGTTRVFQLDGQQSMINYDINVPVTFTCGAFSPDDKWIVVGGDDKLARMWKVRSADAAAEKPIVLKGHADRIEDVKILMDGSSQPRVLTASRDKSARVWDPRLDSSEKLAREVIALRRHTQGVTAIDVTPDGQTIMTAGRDGNVILWPAAKREPPTDPENVFDSL